MVCELEIKLGIVKCKSGYSEHIFNGICQFIDEYDRVCSFRYYNQ